MSMNQIQWSKNAMSSRIALLALVTFCLMFSQTVLAFHQIKWKTTSEGEFFTIIHEDYGQYFVEAYMIPDQKLQLKISSHQFAELAQAFAFFEQKTQGFDVNRSKANKLKEGIWTEDPRRRLWLAQNHWTEEWEDRYSEWIHTEVTSDYLYKYKVAVDCANVPIALRWIFARLNSLPAGNLLAGSNIMFSNESFRRDWDNLPTHEDWHQDELFLTALNYVLDHTYTHSLMNDLYPIAINQETIRPGIVFLNLYNERTGHTELVRDFIYDINHPAPLRVIAADVPRKVRILPEYGFRKWSGSLIEEKHGFFKFRWPVLVDNRVVYLDKPSMPWHSLEQFQPDFVAGYKDYLHALIDRLIPGWTPDASKMMATMVEVIVDRFRARVKIVEDGYQFCSQNPGGCPPGSMEWEVWSTPSRDGVTRSIQADIDRLYEDSDCGFFCRRQLSRRHNEIITQLGSNRIRLIDAMNIWRDQLYSYDPNDPIHVRWGINP
jgi:hypothetical protein